MRKGSRQKQGGRGTPRRAKRSGRNGATPRDAIALLKADHRQVEQWFGQFENTRSPGRKSDLATKICKALKTHMTLEEEIFYPAFLGATQEEAIHHEAEVEHDGAKKLIAEIENAGPEDEYFHARVTVLAEMIRHHVKEEEQAEGMFSKARAADDMDRVALGAKLAARKAQVMGGAGEDEPEAAGRRPRSAAREAGMMARGARR